MFRQLDFTWDSPDIICITGANGAGKTTLLSMLTGAMPPDVGNVLVQGRSLVDQHHSAVQLIAYVPYANTHSR